MSRPHYFSGALVAVLACSSAHSRPDAGPSATFSCGDHESDRSVSILIVKTADQDGELLPGVVITLRRDGAAEPSRLSSDAEGIADTLVESGKYSIGFEFFGYLSPAMSVDLPEGTKCELKARLVWDPANPVIY